MATRTTRSRSRQQSATRGAQGETSTKPLRLILKEASLRTEISSLPDPLSPEVVNISLEDFDLLWLKQTKLRNPTGQVPTFIQSLRSGGETIGQAAAATLIFAQHEAGTAVCVSADGLLLTCSHCVAESREDFERRVDKWLIFASGCVVRAECVVWDDRRDLALLQIVAAQQKPHDSGVGPSFPFITFGTAQGSHLLCIGHPGSEDLEASTSGIETDYDVLHVSTGRFRGLAPDQDPQDNSEIGALMHDCWTYWGHSGAPLISRSNGKLVGLHSSWDDETGMRRGVPLVAIRAFLDEHTIMVVGDEDM